MLTDDPMPAFDIQRALTDMEGRIREDICTVSKHIGAEAAKAQAVADACTLARTKLEGRIMGLEEKAGWIGAGFGATVLALLGFLWHILTAGIKR